MPEARSKTARYVEIEQWLRDRVMALASPDHDVRLTTG